jgi:multiple sugar transport system ATP-binding protein
MAEVTLSRVQKSYGALDIIHGADLGIHDGEFVVLVGPSGCGKSTLLRMIAGLETITGGTIRIGGRVVNDLDPKDRDIAMVFQNYALYPHMTVATNMGFSLEHRGTSKAEIAERVNWAADILGLTQLLDRYPRQLSGGPTPTRRHGPGNRAQPAGLPV